LSDETRKILIDNVNIVIHCAATADLNARLDNAVKINVRGPMEVLRFVSQIKNLENFVYVSTCYVNSDKKFVYLDMLLLKRE
jgi:fatty acyl-CoA reductase